MFSKLKIIIFTLNVMLLLQVEAKNTITKPKIDVAANRNLFNFMISTRDVSNQHPKRSLACFDYYVPILNGITNEYEASYAACLNAAEKSKIEIEESLLGQQDCMTATASNACDVLKACSEIKDSIGCFECYKDAGNQNAKIMYGISQNASDILINTQERYRLVDFNKDLCTNASERAYVTNTSATYEELQKCLLGLTPVPEGDDTATDAAAAGEKVVEAATLVEAQKDLEIEAQNENLTIADEKMKKKRTKKPLKAEKPHLNSQQQ